ncbi:hypothetical protein EYZ11_008449 [Aspergillus tanneri]|uniref:Cation efflux protein transmembrane domain-containing protein n=1 Tax=Aspergillus tanneri TaxID=1220188 RepID=A0A4S3JAJ0_9EURO|nr:uncharacterized protein ATNIH1004_007749 [Aspergillus tanneri]KAA8646322.1 hypothetical protein ATNIH1004_007749 [Aspergillus tanneri]THC92096.1 hypothetical protein EYZ11_008449 [Aspergillus tanneri]
MTSSMLRSNSTPQFPPSSPPLSPDSIQPRTPTLAREGEILSTRGQSLARLIRRRSVSVQSRDDQDGGFQQDDLVTPWERMDKVPLERARRLIGNIKPMYNWQWHYRDPDTLKGLSKSLRKYYEHNNELIAQYVYIDRLLDSPLPHRLIGDYHHQSDLFDNDAVVMSEGGSTASDRAGPKKSGKVKRTPQNLYRIPDENSPLLPASADENAPSSPEIVAKRHDLVDSEDRIVTLSIYINFAANVVLLAAKIAVMSMTNSLSVLASLVDGILDFLSTAIVWATTKLIKNDDRYRYPISRRRLEPLSVLVFAVVMIVSFVQVALTSLGRLVSTEHTLVELSIPSIAVMASTVLVKLACWLWCRLIKNSSVQALAQDAMTDVIFNLFSILFPLIGSLTRTWFIDPLGGLLLSVYIIWNWTGTAAEHISHLTGTAASGIDHSILLYMTMRFSKAILNIQDLKAYYAGDRLNVEVDIVFEAKTSLRDSHDIGESLQYMIESVPTVDRAFVHADYDPWNIPSHMNQRES